MWYSWCVNVDSYVLCAVITIPLFLSIVKLQKSKRYHQLNCTFPFVELWRNMKIIIWCNNYMDAQSFYAESLNLFVPFSIWSLYFLFFLELPFCLHLWYLQIFLQSWLRWLIAESYCFHIYQICLQGEHKIVDFLTTHLDLFNVIIMTIIGNP
jgi:hypothetical protein